MTEPPVTRPSLLVRLRDPRDGPAWAQFVEVYAPPVYGFARRQGLQDADAADLTQEVLQTVAAAIRRLDYDRGRGSFRGWLFSVVRSRRTGSWRDEKNARLRSLGSVRQ
jgi:RNA polymerase sigma-70 factor (ECF subfamily)